MAYSDFDLKKVTTDFALVREESLDLFAGVSPVEPSDHLREWLAEFAPLAIGIGSERGRGEAIIFPVLLYNYTAALALYMCCSSTIAILESRIVRAKDLKEGGTGRVSVPVRVRS